MARGSPYGLAVAQLWRPRSDTCENGASAQSSQGPATSFELADVMELGCAPGTVEPRLLEARREGLSMCRLSVRRSKDKQEYALHDHVGKILLVARLHKNAQEDGIDIFTAAGADAKSSSHPALRLAYDTEKGLWRLSSLRCSCCEYRLARHLMGRHSSLRRELARVRHFSEPLENGQGLLRMEVQVPGPLQDGGRAVWCPLQPKEVQEKTFRVNSRMPSGGTAGDNLQLDFGHGGRCKMASAKNFAVCWGEAPSTHSAGGPGVRDILQFGKIEDNVYSLDFRHPFSAVEAFGVALTTTVWI